MFFRKYGTFIDTDIPNNLVLKLPWYDSVISISPQIKPKKQPASAHTNHIWMLDIRQYDLLLMSRLNSSRFVEWHPNTIRVQTGKFENQSDTRTH